jgi:hypothetical protein
MEMGQEGAFFKVSPQRRALSDEDLSEQFIGIDMCGWIKIGEIVDMEYSEWAADWRDGAGALHGY